MHQREQLKSKHQAEQMENQKEVSKTSLEKESLLTLPGERSYYALEQRSNLRR